MDGFFFFGKEVINYFNYAQSNIDLFKKNCSLMVRRWRVVEGEMAVCLFHHTSEKQNEIYMITCTTLVYARTCCI